MPGPYQHDFRPFQLPQPIEHCALCGGAWATMGVSQPNDCDNELLDFMVVCTREFPPSFGSFTEGQRRAAIGQMFERANERRGWQFVPIRIPTRRVPLAASA